MSRQQTTIRAPANLPEVNEEYAGGDSYQGTVKLVRAPQSQLTGNAQSSTQPSSVKHGTGRYGFADGSYYFGQWAEGQMEGKGVFYEASTGDKFDGVWEGGRRIQGVYRYANGDMYIGGFDRETGSKKTGPSLVLDDCVLYKAIYREDRLIKRELVLLPIHNSWESLIQGEKNSNSTREPSPPKRAASPVWGGPQPRNNSTSVLSPPQYKAPRKVSLQNPNSPGLSSPFSRNDTKNSKRDVSFPASPTKKTSTVGTAPVLRTADRCESPTRKEKFAALEQEIKASPARASNHYYEDVGRDQLQPMDTEDSIDHHAKNGDDLKNGEKQMVSNAEGAVVVANAPQAETIVGQQHPLTQEQALETAKSILRQKRDATSPTRQNSAFGSFHNSYASNASLNVNPNAQRSTSPTQKLNRNGSVVMPPPNPRTPTCRSLSGSAFGNLQRGVTEHIDDVSRKEMQQAFRYFNTSPRRER